MASITDYKGNRDNLTNCKYSGLMNYLFGKNRDKTINHQDFINLQRDLIDDIMWLEFCRYSKDGRTISDLDLCNHLLCCANLTTKQRRQMVRIISTQNVYPVMKINNHITTHTRIYCIFSVVQLHRVKRDVEGNSLKGRITYEAFKDFYLVLFGGADLERAMFFLDTEKKGVNRQSSINQLNNVVAYYIIKLCPIHN